ncbi:MAG TPA: zinc ribbon domain-containing protein, partial [Actinomycetota bacterium]|nr:zinc ribbon domain-containing protein [Actinomycetota bacterium]
MIACRDCGTENPEVATFCRNARCGAFLGWHSAGDAATAPLPVAREVEDVDRVQELFVGVAPRGTARADPAGTPGVDLWVHPAAVEVEPGAPALIELRVHNSGTVVDRITISVEGDAAPWATVVVGGPAEAAPRASGDANLYPGDGASATISLDPPRDPPARAGTVRLVVRARSSEDPAVSATRHVTVVVRR